MQTCDFEVSLLEPPTVSIDTAERLLGLTFFRDIGVDALTSLQVELEWLHLRAQQVLFEAGQPADSMYIVVSGRLEVFRHDDGSETVIQRIPAGAPVGEMDLLSGAPRGASVRAARDSVLVRITREAWERVADEHPRILRVVNRVLIDRLATTKSPRSVAPFPVIAVVPASPGAPVERLSALLLAELAALGRARVVSAVSADAELGAGTASAEHGRHRARLTEWLDKVERQSDFLLLLGDGRGGAWNDRVVRQRRRRPAGRRGRPRAGRTRALARLCAPPSSSVARRELVLVHPDGRREPSGAGRWLDAIPVAAHHHLRLGVPEDGKRLARFVTGRSVALALSGGASRGFVHVGVIRALREAGIPIDSVCGTSIGALIGAQCALGWEPQRIRDALHRGLVERSPLDYTVPICSAISGKRLESMLQEILGDRQIEDTWLRFACVSASLGRAVPVVHQRGPLWFGVRCSASLPGVVPPVEHEGDLLVDGGLLDNLPALLARDLGRGRTVAVNVINALGSAELSELAGGERALPRIARLIAPGARSRVPPIMNLVMHGMFLSTVSAAAHIRDEVDLFIEPDVSRFWFLDATCLDAAIAAGHDAAQRAIPAWLARDAARVGPPGHGPQRRPQSTAEIRVGAVDLAGARVVARLDIDVARGVAGPEA